MSGPRLNPWWTMWFRPRATMREILENYPKKLVHTLAILGAFTHVAGSSSFFWSSWWATLLIWFFIAVLSGLIALYIFGGLLKWTGNWLKGEGNFQHILSAIAWAQIPIIYFFVIEMIILAIVGGASSHIVYATIRFVLSVWGFGIFLCCLMEAQKFTFFRALINYILALVILIIFLVIINVIITFIAKPFSSCIPKTTPQTG